LKKFTGFLLERRGALGGLIAPQGRFYNGAA